MANATGLFRVLHCPWVVEKALVAAAGDRGYHHAVYRAPLDPDTALPTGFKKREAVEGFPFDRSPSTETTRALKPRWTLTPTSHSSRSVDVMSVTPIMKQSQQNHAASLQDKGQAGAKQTGSSKAGTKQALAYQAGAWASRERAQLAVALLRKHKDKTPSDLCLKDGPSNRRG
eukprot:XP_014003584.1 PREDICTED: doublecortin domain-containing protein 1 isoform X2 [Salmo salar]